jgi:hypothetical protein
MTDAEELWFLTAARRDPDGPESAMLAKMADLRLLATLAIYVIQNEGLDPVIALTQTAENFRFGINQDMLEEIEFLVKATREMFEAKTKGGRDERN